MLRSEIVNYVPLQITAGAAAVPTCDLYRLRATSIYTLPLLPDHHPNRSLDCSLPTFQLDRQYRRLLVHYDTTLLGYRCKRICRT